MKRYFFILFFLSLVVQAVEVQSQSITWNRTYNGPYNWHDESYDICQTNDGNFVAVGFTRNPNYSVCALKINQYGDTIWFKILNTNALSYRSALSVTNTSDGGCVFTGDDDSLFVVKLDQAGNLDWKKYYGSGKGYDILNTMDNHFIICGSGGFILKINNNGEKIWKKYFNFSILRKSMLSLDEGYILTGSANYSNVSNAILIKVDTAGNLKWLSHFEFHNSSFSIALSINNNSYIIAGRINKGFGEISENFFLKTDLSGKELFRKIFLSNVTESFNDMVSINNNRFAICMNRDSNSNNPIYYLSKIIIIDSTGNILRERIYNSVETQYLGSVLLTGTKDLLFTGYSRPVTFGGFDDIWILRTDTLLQSPSVNIKNIVTELSKSFYLYQNYPNPFNPNTNIKFNIPKTCLVKIYIYDISGKFVKSLLNKLLISGSYELDFNGSELSSGTYIYSFYINDKILNSKKMQLIK